MWLADFIKINSHINYFKLTAVNHYLDVSIVYGNNDQVNQQVRQFQGGRLRVDIREGQQWPPRSLNASGICTTQNPQEACYLAGKFMNIYFFIF